MLSTIDHYSSLLRAVARLDRSSYEARGAIYDRALTALAKNLTSAVPPYSEADIDRELLAFREAVHRVEFGDLDERDRLAQPATTDRIARAVSRHELRHDLDAVSQPGPPRAAARAQRPASSVGAPPVREHEVVPAVAATPRARSVVGRVAVRAGIAAALIVFGVAGYAYLAGQLDLPGFGQIVDRLASLAWPSRRGGSPAVLSESATYYEQAGAAAPWRELGGRALWHARREATSGARKSAVVLQLDVQVPERGLSMALVMRRDESENAAISHLIELAFTDLQGAPADAVTGVSSIVMKQLDGSGSTALAGRSIRVAPGLFLFGLSAEKEDAQRNTESLRNLSRIDIPLVFADASTGIMSVSKGASAERAFAEALADWAR